MTINDLISIYSRYSINIDADNTPMIETCYLKNTCILAKIFLIAFPALQLDI